MCSLIKQRLSKFRVELNLHSVNITSMLTPVLNPCPHFELR